MKVTSRRHGGIRKCLLTYCLNLQMGGNCYRGISSTWLASQIVSWQSAQLWLSKLNAICLIAPSTQPHPTVNEVSYKALQGYMFWLSMWARLRSSRLIMFAVIVFIHTDCTRITEERKFLWVMCSMKSNELS